MPGGAWRVSSAIKKSQSSWKHLTEEHAKATLCDCFAENLLDMGLKRSDQKRERLRGTFQQIAATTSSSFVSSLQRPISCFYLKPLLLFSCAVKLTQNTHKTV